MDYKDYNDNELLWYVAENHEDAIEIVYQKYEPLIVHTAKKMHEYCKYSGLELSDLMQEGRLGLVDAMTKYNEQRDVTFYTFAKTCIERKMISTVIATRRLKHRILNESIFYDSTSEEGGMHLEHLLKDNRSNPEHLILNNEREEKMITRTKEQLTDFESQVFELKISNFNYGEIAEILDKDKKSIDNALQRIKLKMKKVLKELNQ